MKTIDQYRSLLERALTEAGLKTSLANKQKLARAIIDADRSQLTGAKAELWDIMLGGGQKEPQTFFPGKPEPIPGAILVQVGPGEYSQSQRELCCVLSMSEDREKAVVHYKGYRRAVVKVSGEPPAHPEEYFWRMKSGFQKPKTN